MKKLYLTILFLTLLCVSVKLLPFASGAETVYTGGYDQISYRIEADGTLYIDCTGELYASSSQSAWLWRSEEIKAIVIGEGATSLRANVFQNLPNLTRVSLPSTLESIGRQAFSGCTQLSDVSFPNALKCIGGNAFYSCRSLKKLNLPNGLETLESGAFLGCEGLTEASVPDSVTTLGGSVFSLCSNLRRAKLPKDLAVIPEYTFCGTAITKLEDVTFPQGRYEMLEGVFRSSALQEARLPEGMRNTGVSSFSGCPKLRLVVLPETLEKVDTLAFYDSNAIERFEVYNPELEIAISHEAVNQYETEVSTLGGSVDTVIACYYGSTAYYYASCDPQSYTKFEFFRGCELGYHNWSAGSIVVRPTCAAEGLWRQVCADCGQTQDETLPRTEHRYLLRGYETEPTYFTEGVGIYTCTVCGDSYTEAVKKLNPGYCFQQVLYDRTDWSGAFVIGGYDFSYYESGPVLNGLRLMDPRLGAEHRSYLYDRFGVYNVQPNTSQYVFVFEKLDDGNYTVRSYWTGDYLTNQDGSLAVTAEPDAGAEWSIFVEDGYFAFVSALEPEKRLLYNELDRRFMLLSTYTYEGTTYQASDLFGIWLYESDPCISFTDVNPTAWYHPGIDFAVANGLFNGLSPQLFGVSDSMTRAMFVTVLWRMQGNPAAKQSAGFTDVPEGKYYSEAVSWAAAEGLVNGTSATTFSPNASITREQMATLLYRYADWLRFDVSARAELSGFPDAGAVSNYAKDPVAWANGLGIIQGTSSAGRVLLDPKGNATRAQVATILMRFVTSYLGG